MIVLGIETSCDETAVGIVEIGDDQNCRLLANVVATSIDLHTVYGGVVPEIAARSHIEYMMPVVKEALQTAFGKELDSDPWDQVDAIAVTYGAGLGGSLLVGVMTARTLAIVKDKPLYGINHVEAHVYANFLSPPAPQFPLLALIVSGGHTQLAVFQGHFDYKLLGITRDDAVGEAFDKVAKILGLPYPGGPSVSAAAEKGDANKYSFTKPKMDGYDFSFSGLKTAVLRLAQKEIGEDFTFPSFKIAERLSEDQKNDIAASFQRVAIEILVDKTVTAYEEYQPASVVIAGGVAASGELRRQLSERVPIDIAYPDFKLCTDNGAMVAALGCFKLLLGQPAADPYSLDINPNLKM